MPFRTCVYAEYIAGAVIRGGWYVAQDAAIGSGSATDVSLLARFSTAFRVFPDAGHREERPIFPVIEGVLL